MKDKLKYLTRVSLKKKISSKWFIVVNLLLLICIPLLCNIDNVIKYFGGDFLEPTEIYVVDNTGYMFDSFEDTFKSTNKIILKDKEYKVIESKKSVSELSSSFKKDKSKNIIVVINNDNKNLISSNIISYKTVDAYLYQNIVNSLNLTKKQISLNNSDIDINELNNINKDISIKRTYLSKKAKKDSELINTIGKYIIPSFILPFFFLIILAVQMIGTEINDEKTSRSMEIIISSVSHKVHFASKMIAVNVFVFIQGLLIILYAVLGVFIRVYTTGSKMVDSLGIDAKEMLNSVLNNSMMHDVLTAIPFTIILLIASFIAYSLIAGILASITTSAEDFSQLQTPIMIVLMLAYYIAIIASSYESSIFIKVTGFIPLLSSIIAPVLFVLGQFTIWEFIISIILTILLIILLVKYGLKIYKVGILNYSSNHLWKKMFKALKN